MVVYFPVEYSVSIWGHCRRVSRQGLKIFTTLIFLRLRITRSYLSLFSALRTESFGRLLIFKIDSCNEITVSAKVNKCLHVLVDQDLFYEMRVSINKTVYFTFTMGIAANSTPLSINFTLIRIYVPKCVSCTLVLQKTIISVR